ncbi:SRPBCC domain-containing protein [Nocardia sp. GCM10030253]|uniref:SRPBCC family protein n=1 Tax=Nocardia sp. GCM10030253 TaxID=3273404 RepID=UPI0036302931
MSDQNFTTTVTVDRTTAEAFDAINNVRGWWSEDIEGDTEKIGDEFFFNLEDVHRCKMKLTEVVPGEKVVWHVSDSWIDFIEDKTEWDDTEIVFEISEKDGETEIRFTHVGLVPAIECFDICSNAWGSYVTGSLRSLITTGKGDPSRKTDTFDTELLKHQKQG